MNMKALLVYYVIILLGATVGADAGAAGFPESADSNHIRFTPPAVAQTILVPGQPSSVTISWE